MGVTLVSQKAGSVDLPFPALNQPIETVSNQSVAYSAAGTPRTFIHGPPRWKISRTFESLTEDQVSAVMEWWEKHGRSGPPLVYRWTDFDDKKSRTAVCRIIEEPRQTRVAKQIYDLTLAFEFEIHPDRKTLSSPIAQANASRIFNPVLPRILRGGVSVPSGSVRILSTGMKLVLLTEGYAFDKTSGNYSDVSSWEIVGEGYTAGGKEITGTAVDIESDSGVVRYTCDDVAWENATFSARYGAICDAADGSLIQFIDFGFELSVVAGTFTVPSPLSLALQFTLRKPGLQVDSNILPDVLSAGARLRDPAPLSIAAASLLSAQATLRIPAVVIDNASSQVLLSAKGTLWAPAIVINSGNLATPPKLAASGILHAPTVAISDGVAGAPGTLQAAATQHAPTVDVFNEREVQQAAATLHQPEVWLGIVEPSVQSAVATLRSPSLKIDQETELRLPASVSQTETGVTWNDASNVKACDGQHATAALTGSATLSKRLEVIDFQLPIPTSATIRGIEAEIERHGPGGAIGDWLVRLRTSSGLVGDNKADFSTKWPTSDAAKIYGGPNDRWNTTLSAIDLTAPGFGLALIAHFDAAGGLGTDTAKINCIKIKVYYTLN